MAKKKTTYYQALCYTTDHCDCDLIPPSFWKPTKDRKEAAKQLMDEMEESFADRLDSKYPGPSELTIDFKHTTDDDLSWETKVIHSWKRSKKFLTKLADGLANGTIGTVMVTVPEYLNCWNALIEQRSDVFNINSFTI